MEFCFFFDGNSFGFIVDCCCRWEDESFNWLELIENGNCIGYVVVIVRKGINDWFIYFNRWG